MGKEWIKVKNIGQLYWEKTLVTFDFPVLFVCKDFENRKYLCLNIDDETGETIIALTNNRYLIDMLIDKKPMDFVFKNALDNKITLVKYDDNNKIVSSVREVNDVSKDLLPKEGEYFELHNKMLDEYIDFLKNQLLKLEYDKCFNNNIGVISKLAFYSINDIDSLFERFFEKNFLEKNINYTYKISSKDEMIA